MLETTVLVVGIVLAGGALGAGVLRMVLAEQSSAAAGDLITRSPVVRRLDVVILVLGVALVLSLLGYVLLGVRH